MTREECKLIVKGLKAVFSEPTFIVDQYAFEMWFRALRDLDYKVCELATDRYIQSESKTPKPADIRKYVLKNAQQEELNEVSAWGMVERALRNSIYGSEEEFAKLPKVVQKAVGSAEQLKAWATEDISHTQVMASNFMRAFKQEQRKQAERDMISPQILKRIENIGCINNDSLIGENEKCKGIMLND